MSHHSSNFDPEMSEEMLKHFAEAGQKADASIQDILSKRLGPTGQFPHGKLTDQDEGELVFTIFPKEGKLVIDFDSPVRWLGMTPEQAIALGRLLIKRGRKLL